MENKATQLVAALKSLADCSGGWVECGEIGDLNGAERELVNYCQAVIDESTTIGVFFPREDEDISWPIDEVIRHASECETLAEGKHISLRTKHLALQIVTPVNDKAHLALDSDERFEVESNDKISVCLKRCSIPVGVYAATNGAWHKRFLGSVTTYPVIQLDCSACADRTQVDEMNLVDAFLFELASSHDIVFQRGEFLYPDDPEDEAIETIHNAKMRPLEPSNEGIRLYVAAAQIGDCSLRFFSFYKVLEFFAPTVLNLEAHDSIGKKLGSKSAMAPTGQFIREILQLAKSFDQRRNDRDLIKGVLLTAVDLVGLSEFVPASMRREVTHETPRKEVEQYARDIAECICATRNQVAHSKATYDSPGTECPPPEMELFTQFIARVAGECIRWYNRLPEHQRADLALAGAK